MKNPSFLLPLDVLIFVMQKFGHATSIRKLTWEDFKGQPDETMSWSAHIYWNIDYLIVDYDKKKVSAKLCITKKSWVRQDRKCDHLLNH